MSMNKKLSSSGLSLALALTSLSSLTGCPAPVVESDTKSSNPSVSASSATSVGGGSGAVSPSPTPVAVASPSPSPSATPAPGAGSIIGIGGMAAWDALSTTEKNRVLTGWKTTFLHQSVGQDLEDGASSVGYDFQYITSGATSLSNGLNGGLFNASNGSPAAKVTEFRNLAVANKATLRVAIMKFGYADVVDANIATAQSNYLAAVATIKAQGVRVMHVTPPLVYNSPVENAAKAQMRTWMFNNFPNDVIFDLNDAESTEPSNGSRCERSGSWEICQAVRSTAGCPSHGQGVDAPSGQGHLCFNPHAARLGKAFLYSIYQAGR